MALRLGEQMLGSSSQQPRDVVMPSEIWRSQRPTTQFVSLVGGQKEALFLPSKPKLLWGTWV